MKIAVAGTGYVGLSIATLLARQNHVMAVDIIPERVEMNKIKPILIRKVSEEFSNRDAKRV